MKFTLQDLYPNTIEFQPTRELEDFRVIETESEYIKRMKSNLLKNFPEEVLKEWLYRHAAAMEKYAFLDFTTFQFSLKTWDIEQIPNREAFDEPSFCDKFQNISERARLNKHDWLAHYMLQKGTWNTPIILLDNSDSNYLFPHNQKPLKSPFHLIEGHRRLSFVNGLKNIGKAQKFHQVYIITKSNKCD